MPAVKPLRGAGLPPDVSRVLGSVRSHLADNLLPFWTRETWDARGGGFITHLDRAGCPSGSTDKCLVSQAGIIWSLAAAHRHGLTGLGYLDLAAQGVRFLLDRMWDSKSGGFFWKVARDGRVVDARKETLGQAVAIYALSEFANASGDSEGLSSANSLFDLLRERAADDGRGYHEHFDREWVVEPGASKTLLSHLHLMAAFTALARTTGSPTVRDALARVVHLLATRSVHTVHGCASESFDVSWRSVASWRPPITWYGLNVTLAWLLFDAAEVLCAGDDVREIGVNLVHHALAYGFDRKRGGVARYGPRHGHVARAVYLHPRRLAKLWWVQAEFLSAMLDAYRLTGGRDYLAAFEKQLDWIWTRQVDRDAGGWFEAVSWRQGRPLSFRKGDDWRNPFHEVRALVRVARVLEAMEKV